MSVELQPDLAMHRKFAARFFNETWALLDKPNRSAEEDLRMTHLAHASRLHWEFAGTPRNRNVGEWQISRVYSVLGRKESALYHAEISLRIAVENKLGPFLLGYSYEGMARAKAIAGDRTANDFLVKAEAFLERVDDAEDKALLKGDLIAIHAILSDSVKK
jgi:hypothetical protein